MAGICPCTFGNSVSAALSNLKKAKRLNPQNAEQTAFATVLSRCVQHRNAMYQDSPWVYLVKFQLEAEEVLELNTGEETYGQLKEGAAGPLVRRENAVVSFTA